VRDENCTGQSPHKGNQSRGNMFLYPRHSAERRTACSLRLLVQHSSTSRILPVRCESTVPIACGQKSCTQVRKRAERTSLSTPQPSWSFLARRSLVWGHQELPCSKWFKPEKGQLFIHCPLTTTGLRRFLAAFPNKRAPRLGAPVKLAKGCFGHHTLLKRLKKVNNCHGPMKIPNLEGAPWWLYCGA